MVLCAVQDANNDEVPFDDAEKYFVGKAMCEDAAKTTVVNWETFGIGLQS